MPKVPLIVPQIQSWIPSIDPRGSNNVYALSGKNYYFDAKGPKSGFGSRLVAGLSSIEDEGPGAVCQHIEIGNNVYIFTSRGGYVLTEAGTWSQILDLSARFPDVSSADDKKWTTAFLTSGTYFCHPVFGFYKKTQHHGVITLVPRSQDDIPGLPYKPVAICETNGRLVVLGLKYCTWSGPSSAEDFTPTLGGAGQQLISDKVPGNAMSVAGFQNGFLMWTDKGCVAAEFTGGDSVWRWTRSTTKQLPIGAHAIVEFPDGTQTICTNQGLFSIANGGEPQKITPLFSEFLRFRLEHEPGLHVRLSHFRDEDLLFVEIRDWTDKYVHTYVLTLSLDKWGEFNERHHGIVKYKTGRGAIGYVDWAGVVHKFVETFNREYAPHKFKGLDSRLEIGYLRPQELMGEADTLLEMQEIVLGSRPSRPSYAQESIDNETWNGGTLSTIAELTGVVFYFLLDRSNSFSSGDFNAYKAEIKNQLAIIESFVGTLRIDIGIRFYASGSVAMEKIDCDHGDFTDFYNFIDSTPQQSGGDVLSAMTLVRAYFDQTKNDSILQGRNIVFLTDSNSEDGMGAAAAGPAYDFVNRTGDYTVAAGTSVDIWGILYGNTDTTNIAKLDNTPQDGIPVISLGNFEGMANAIRYMLGFYVFESGVDLLQPSGWGVIDGQIEINDQLSLLNPLSYNISVAHDLDGMYHGLLTEPELAREKPGSNLWTLMTSGFWHRMTLEASDDLQFFHIRALQYTFHYQGQLS